MVLVPDISGQTLWSLLIATVMFLACFVLMVGLIPPDTKVQFKNFEKEYRAIVPGADYEGSSFTMFNNSLSNTLTAGGYMDLSGTGLDLFLQWYYIPALGLNELGGTHVEWRIPILNTQVLYHNLVTKEGDVHLSAEYLLSHYDNTTLGSSIEFGCPHINLKMFIRSNSTAYSLSQALQAGHALYVTINYEIDFTKMGANIWVTLAQVLSFQAVVTGNVALDFILNAMISLPIYTSTSYILYRLITGLIPTLSGGGGQ